MPALGQDALDDCWEAFCRSSRCRAHANVAQRLAVLLGSLARKAGLLSQIGILNLGEARNYRVHGCWLFRPGPDERYGPTDAVVGKVVFRGDESWTKFPSELRQRITGPRLNGLVAAG